VRHLVGGGKRCGCTWGGGGIGQAPSDEGSYFTADTIEKEYRLPKFRKEWTLKRTTTGGRTLSLGPPLRGGIVS